MNEIVIKVPEGWWHKLFLLAVLIALLVIVTPKYIEWINNYNEKIDFDTPCCTCLGNNECVLP